MICFSRSESVINLPSESVSKLERCDQVQGTADRNASSSSSDAGYLSDENNENNTTGPCQKRDAMTSQDDVVYTQMRPAKEHGETTENNIDTI